MKRKTLIVLGGLFVAAALALRRRRRRNAVEVERDEPGVQVEIDEPRAGEPAAPDTGRATEERVPAVDLESIEGIGPAYADRLREAGVSDGADLVAADPDALAAETDIGESRIRGWVERTRDRVDA